MIIKTRSAAAMVLAVYFSFTLTAEAGFFKDRISSLFKGRKRSVSEKNHEKKATAATKEKKDIEAQIDKLVIKNIKNSLDKKILIASNEISTTSEKAAKKKIKLKTPAEKKVMTPVKKAFINRAISSVTPEKGIKSLIKPAPGKTRKNRKKGIKKVSKKTGVASKKSGTEIFADLPTSHWAYDAVLELESKGYLKGYADGTFKGKDNLTRYELSMVVNRLYQNMKPAYTPEEDLELLRNLSAECKDSLANMQQRVNRLDMELKDIAVSRKMAAFDKSVKGKNSSAPNSSISISGDMTFSFNSTKHSVDHNPDNTWHEFELGLDFNAQIFDKADFFARISRDKIDLGEIGSQGDIVIEEAWLELGDVLSCINEISSLKIGRHKIGIGNSLVLNDTLGGITLKGSKGRLSGSIFAFSSNTDNGNINGQLYGDDFSKGFSEAQTRAAAIAAGNDPGEKFYIQARTAEITQGSGNINFTTGAGLSTGGAWTYTPGDAITVNQAPYAGPNPDDSFTGSKTGAPADWKYNNSRGIAVYPVLGPTRLLPIDQTAVIGSWAPVPALNALDSYNTDSQNMTLAGRTRDYQIDSKDGLDSWGFNLNYRMDNHVVGAYFLQQHYYRFDPYTRLGDPWAAVTDYNGDNIPDTDVNGYDLSPESDPSYLGLTLKGNLKHNLDYFFELVCFDPDINNVGVNVYNGTARTNNSWNGNNLDKGIAWLGGLKYKPFEKTNLLMQLGSGDEEFVPAAIHEDNYLNGMKGRYHDAVSMPAAYWPSFRGSGSLTGIRDFLLKADHSLDHKTKGIFTFEKVWENDSSAERMISGDSSVTGHASQDYSRFNLALEHQYMPNTKIKLEYENLMFSDSAADDAHFFGNTASRDDDIDAGGFQTVTAELSVGF